MKQNDNFGHCGMDACNQKMEEQNSNRSQWEKILFLLSLWIMCPNTIRYQIIIQIPFCVFRMITIYECVFLKFIKMSCDN